MPTSSAPNTLGESNLVFAYDTGDTVNSFRGQPTTNDYGSNFRDFTGTGYSPYGEWVSTEPTRFTKTYYPNLNTPIGPGGTLVEESGTAGYHHLSRYGGGEESGAHSLSCYIYPLVSGITDFCIGMLGDSNNNIRFNLDTRVITYGGGISNTNAFIRDVPGYPGWLRVGANIEGRGGGWVGCFGYSSYTSYTGTAGGKKAYITGIQYEYTTQPTPFVAGTRSATQGLLPLVGNSTINLSNVSFNSNAQLVFDGTNDYVDCGAIQPFDLSARNVTWEAVVKFNDSSGVEAVITRWSNSIGTVWWFGRYPTTKIHLAFIINGSYYDYYSNGDIGTTPGYHHIVATLNNTVLTYYINGVLDSTDTVTAGTWTSDSDPSLIIGAQDQGAAANINGEIPVAKIYNRVLTAQEVKQNYQQYKTRFNLS
jgi:hypothetical protein